MNEWQVKKVKDLCDIGRGRVISQEEIEKNLGIYPVYSSQSSNKGEMGKIDTYDFEGEYVTWTTDGAYAGTVFHRTGKFNCTNVCGTLKAKDENLSTEFLAYLLSTVAKNHVSYVGNPKLMNNVMAQIDLLLPTEKKEQEKIAAVLSSVDKAIEQTEKLIEKQKRIKRGLLHDLLTKGIDAGGAIRSEATHEFKDSPLGRIPKDWEIYIFEQIIESAVDGPFGSNLKTEHYTNEGVRIVRLQNIGIGFFNNKDKAYISQEHAIFLKRHQIKSGDLIVASMGDPKYPIARACLYPENFSDGIVKADCFRIRLKKKLALNAFIMYMFNCPSTRHDLNALGQGVTRDRATLGKIKEIRIFIAPLEEQRQIISILEKQDENIIDLQVKLEKLKAIKKGLMQDLLTENAESRIGNLLAE